MTNLEPIEHVPIDMGLGEEVKPRGQIRLSYHDDFDGEDLVAEFDVAADFSEILRIEIAGPVIVRALDETWLSTATNHNRWTGDLSAFARRVIGDDFADMHRLFFVVHPTAAHYQFVTGSACLDVIATSPPRFSLLRVADR